MLMVRCACASRSTRSTRWPRSARAAPRLTAVVVLPTPPFWFATAITRAIRGRVYPKPSWAARTMPAMFLIPLAAGVVGVVFGILVVRQFLQRRRPYQAAWGFALLLFGAAALFEAAGIAGGWTAAEYRGYYLLGGILNVGWLGTGSVYIHFRRAGHVAAVVMALVTVAAIPAVLVAPIDAH